MKGRDAASGMLLRNVLSSSVGQVVASALSVGCTVITARWLGASGRGVLALVSTGSAVVALVLCGGVPQAITTFIARSKMSYQRAVSMSIALAIVAALGGALAGAVVFSAGRAAWNVVPLLMVGAAAVSLSLSQVMLAGGLGRVDIAVTNTVVSAGSLLVGYAAGWAMGLAPGPSVALACVVWVAGQLVGDGVGWGLLSRVRRERVATQVAGRELAAYAVAAYPGVLVGQLNARLDVLLLGAVASVSAVGIYATAVVAASLVFVVPAAIGSSLSKPFGDESTDGGRMVRIGALASLGFAVIVSLVVAGGLYFGAAPLLGPEFRKVVLPVALMTPGMALFAAAYPAGSYFGTRLGRPGLNTVVVGIALLIDIALLLPLGRAYGASGAAIASTAGYAVAGLVNLGLIVRYASPVDGWSVAVVRAETAEAVRLAGSTLRRMVSR